jgi:16S rRNA (guanine1207-N2)-methyltransferase
VTAAGLSDGAASAALEALFVPFSSGDLAFPVDARVLFLRARAGVILHRWPGTTWLCEQSFKPFAETLIRAGLHVGQLESGETFPVVLVLPPRQRDEARALFARAIAHAGPTGIVVASMPNAEGARSGEADLQRLAGPVSHLSKHKCRVFWTRPSADGIDRDLLAEWAALDLPRPVADGRFVSRPGLFAWDRVDSASALLASQLPDTLSGRVADLGAGYGYLSAHLLRHCPQITALDLYEAEARALEPARINLALAASERESEVVVDVLWHDVTTGLPHRYDAIVSNPPFHQGRADQPDLGRAFIAAAADALLPGGCLWLVANRHLPYEATLEARFNHVRTVIVQDGFKVIEASGVRQ